MNASPDKILIIDDDEQLTDILSVLLESEGYATQVCATGIAASRAFAEETLSLALLDIRLGEEDGLALLPRLREIDPNVPILMITAHGDVESAVESFKSGASGYIRKPFEEGHLKAQISQAIEKYRLKRDLRAFRITRDGTDVRSIFRSRDLVMEPTLQRIATAARVSSNVVITGESGTGKELVAKALHACGPRASGPFVAFNCAALPETLIESELFGHTKGAYTDAREAKPGLFALANGGTLFIDEIGDAPLAIQSKLLRAIQEREILPIGGKAPIKVDVRIVVATHRSLAEEVAKGRFRQDLYYRLQVIPIQIPPLRERKRDIIYLASIFATQMAEQMGLPFEGFSDNAIRVMEAHPWPGNVRELQNRVEHALVLGKPGRISAASLFPESASLPAENEIEIPELESAVGSATILDEPLLSFREAKESFEKSYLVRILNEARGNIAHAARIAVKSRAELYGLVKKHGIDPTEFKKLRD